MSEKEEDGNQKKPKIYLVGNPDELGLHGEEWMDAVNTVSALIFGDPDREEHDLGSLWIGETFYYSEHPSVSTEARKLGLRMVGEIPIETKKRLFEVTEQVTDYAIPNEGTKARKVFDAAVRMYIMFSKKDAEIRDKIRDITNEIEKI